MSGLSHTEQGDPLEYDLGTTNASVHLVDSYDQQTDRLTRAVATTVAGTSTSTVDNTGYAYDTAGDVLDAADTNDVQCFQYDYRGRLSQAWAQGSGACAKTPGQSSEGGAAPYWESYRYDVAGNLLGHTDTPATGAATTVTDAYPAAGSSQPHAATSVSSTGPSGTTTTTLAYDADGDTTGVGGATFSWDDQGDLSEVSAPASDTTYQYDAGGDLLLQHDSGTTTLYLNDEQIVLNTSTGALSGTRYYQIGGVTVAARTSAGAVDYLTGNDQGTSLLSIDATTLAVTRRYYDPFGNTRGAAPAAWPGTRGFVGGSTDASTGLTDLGAREYDPALDRFISPDPELNTSDPQSLNPYNYADDNPATDSDATGTICTAGGGEPSCYPRPKPVGTKEGGGSPATRKGGGYSSPLPASHGYVGSSCGMFRCDRVVAATHWTPKPKPKPKPVRVRTTNGRVPRVAMCGNGVAGHFDPSFACHPMKGDNLPEFVKHHYNGIVQVIKYSSMAACLAASAGACALIEGGAALISYGIKAYGSGDAGGENLHELEIDGGLSVLDGGLAGLDGLGEIGSEYRGLARGRQMLKEFKWLDNPYKRPGLVMYFAKHRKPASWPVPVIGGTTKLIIRGAETQNDCIDQRANSDLALEC